MRHAAGVPAGAVRRAHARARTATRPGPPTGTLSRLPKHTPMAPPDAVGAVGGSLLGYAVAGVEGAILGPLVTPALVATVRLGLTALIPRWQRGSRAVEIAADELNLDLDEFSALASADPGRLEPLARVLEAAERSTLDKKIPARPGPRRRPPSRRERRRGAPCRDRPRRDRRAARAAARRDLRTAHPALAGAAICPAGGQPRRSLPPGCTFAGGACTSSRPSRCRGPQERGLLPPEEPQPRDLRGAGTGGEPGSRVRLAPAASSLRGTLEPRA